MCASYKQELMEHVRHGLWLPQGLSAFVITHDDVKITHVSHHLARDERYKCSRGLRQI